jgi:hypothetical protein
VPTSQPRSRRCGVEWHGEEIALHPHEYNAYTHAPPAPFAAWPEWQADEPPAVPDVVNSIWQVIVILPAGDAEPRNSGVPDAAALDAVRWPVRAALKKLGGVGRAEPFSYTVESAHSVPAIRYRLTIRLVGPGGTREEGQVSGESQL